MENSLQIYIIINNTIIIINIYSNFKFNKNNKIYYTIMLRSGVKH